MTFNKPFRKRSLGYRKPPFLFKTIVGIAAFGCALGCDSYLKPIHADSFCDIPVDEQRKQAQFLKAKIDSYLLECLSSAHWNPEITFAQTVDLCIAEIKKNGMLIDSWPDIFYVNQPKDWQRYTTQEVLRLLLEIREEKDIRIIGKKLYNLFYLLPADLQKSQTRLACNLYWRLKIESKESLIT